MREKNPKIKIFIVTSYLDYLDDAMKFHVFRYLSKPIDKARLFRNFKEALYQISMEAEKISIETKEETIICSSDEIVMIEKEDRRVISPYPFPLLRVRRKREILGQAFEVQEL